MTNIISKEELAEALEEAANSLTRAEARVRMLNEFPELEDLRERIIESMHRRLERYHRLAGWKRKMDD